jgi:hypothetical protein
MAKSHLVLSYIPGVLKVQVIDQTLTVCEAILHTLKENLVMAHNCLKQHVNQGRSEHHFVEGNQVFLQLQPYKKTSLKVEHCQKLAPKCYGPYKVLKCIGHVSYQLDFHIHSKLHHVFHVS